MKTKLILKITIAWIIYFIGWIISIYFRSGVGATMLTLFLLIMVGITGILIEEYKEKIKKLKKIKKVKIV
jgi:undecaprenyl pyrophosphate phosphatase UppP